jgi:hypothetical protein
MSKMKFNTLTIIGAAVGGVAVVATGVVLAVKYLNKKKVESQSATTVKPAVVKATTYSPRHQSPNLNEAMERRRHVLRSRSKNKSTVKEPDIEKYPLMES